MHPAGIFCIGRYIHRRIQLPHWPDPPPRKPPRQRPHGNCFQQKRRTGFCIQKICPPEYSFIQSAYPPSILSSRRSLTIQHERPIQSRHLHDQRFEFATFPAQCYNKSKTAIHGSAARSTAAPPYCFSSRLPLQSTEVRAHPPLRKRQSSLPAIRRRAAQFPIKSNGRNTTRRL